MERQIAFKKVPEVNQDVDIFCGLGRINLFGLETWQKFNKVVAKTEESIYKGNGVKISDYAVTKACVVLGQIYRTGKDDFSGLEYLSEVCSLMVKLESWAKKPFGLGWRQGRIDYISRVAEGWEQNSVK